MNKFYTDEKQIIDWLDEYEVKSYTLIRDEKYGFIADVNGDVYLSDKNLTNIPVKFGEITGSFYCNENQLTSLEFSPQTVAGSFFCDNNKLTSLEFCPETVGGYFYCNNNELTSLEFGPKIVGGVFDCENNQLTSLEFCPQTVGEKFYCDDNPELKEIQKITDFKLIYLDHEKILITKFSDKLEHELINDNSRKTAKIKI